MQHWYLRYEHIFNTLRLKQNGRHFQDDIFKRIFLHENVWISINISLKFVPRGTINNIPTLVQVMAWRRPGDKPFSEPMMVRLPTHRCVTRPQWVNQAISVLGIQKPVKNNRCRKYGDFCIVWIACMEQSIHRNGNVILIKFASLAAPEVVIMTTSSAANDEKFVQMPTFRFHCHDILLRMCVQYCPWCQRHG